MLSFAFSGSLQDALSNCAHLELGSSSSGQWKKPGFGKRITLIKEPVCFLSITFLRRGLSPSTFSFQQFFSGRSSIGWCLKDSDLESLL